jgi:hypothetical protein
LTQSAVQTQAPVWPRNRPQARLMPMRDQVEDSRMARCSGLFSQAVTMWPGLPSTPVPHAIVSPASHE